MVLDTRETLMSLTLSALIRSSFIVLTSIHAQDFQDEPGDRVQGRNTLPIVAPIYSRYTMICSLVLWSVWLDYSYAVRVIPAILLFAMGAYFGARFVIFRDVKQDRISYLLYNVSFNLRIHKDRTVLNRLTVCVQVWLASAQITLLCCKRTAN